VLAADAPLSASATMRPATPPAGTPRSDGDMNVEQQVKTDAPLARDAVAVGLNQGAGEMPAWLAGGRSRRAWLLLGERVFSHPRYAMMIVVALGLCAFERYIWIMLPLALFFTFEWCIRFWLQKENGWDNKSELAFLLLDGLATISLFSAMLVPTSVVSQGFYLRLARLFRGMYLLRMLRIFRFLTHDTFVYSLPFALLVVALAGVGLALDRVGLYVGIVLLLELLCRGVSIARVLPEGGRRKAEQAFLPLDLMASVAVTGLIPGLSPFWVLLRLARFLVMLNPLSNIGKAVSKVAQMQEVRSEISMLMGMLVTLLVIGSLSVVYLYPAMDINDDGNMNMADYAPFQIILFVFRLIMDPGAAPPMAYSPWLVGMTVALVMAGVFFFALLVGLGSNVMQFLLRELSNSPLSAREHMMFVGGNAQAITILRQLDRLCVRMRRSFPSVWLFFGEPIAEARSIGRWLTVRQVDNGERGMMARFNLSGIRQLFFFMPADGLETQQDVVDMHHLKRDAQADGLVVADAALSPRLQTLYGQSLAMPVLDSASVAARMLYQMHHCAHMPALGMKLLDVVDGETGLFALHWDIEIEPVGGMSVIQHGGQSLSLEHWLTQCFVQGVNLMAAINESGEPVLFSDLMRAKQTQTFTDVIAIGNTPALWPGILEGALGEAGKAHENVLKTFTWPETWDLSMIFLGWHHGLPAMVEEMALNHHKLTVHVFSTAGEDALTRANRQLHDVADAARSCELKASVHAWDGMDTELLVAQLRGCKVMMFYPEDHDGNSEDSVLELWYHQVAQMLAARKAKAKWWTPPKLMVLPRKGEHVRGFVQAACDYPLLETHVGSPDAFHDVFMARRLLNEACRHFDAEASAQQDKVFRFMEAMLSDTVLVESVESARLLDDDRHGAQPGCKATDWAAVYRESLRRGWLLMGYLMLQPDVQQRNAYALLDTAFPAVQQEHVSGMYLLAGVAANEMDLPLDSAELLFCRRGVLTQQDELKTEEKEQENDLPQRHKDTKKIETVEKEEDLTQKQSDTEESGEAVIDAPAQQEQAVLAVDVAATAAPAEATATAVVMDEAVWPAQADKRLIGVLAAQMDGAQQMLEQSSEDALIKLSEILDMDVGAAVEAKIMAALTDLQHIDRVSQRMNNVKFVLQDWHAALPAASTQQSWIATVQGRYVMAEERAALNDILASAPAGETPESKQPVVDVAADETATAQLDEPVAAEDVPEAEAATEAKEDVKADLKAETEAMTAKPVEEALVEKESAAAVKEEIHVERPDERMPDASLALASLGGADAPATENVLEGEVMADAVWPKVADKRLIRVLEKQVDGSVQLLEQSAEDGLVKLTEILDMGVSAEVEDRIMAALTDLQNIDRVSQRMNNVKSCLHDWGDAAPEAPPAVWKEAVEKRYVMEEERMVLKEEL